jgi:hypothetical protein
MIYGLKLTRLHNIFRQPSGWQMTFSAISNDMKFVFGSMIDVSFDDMKKRFSFEAEPLFIFVE